MTQCAASEVASVDKLRRTASCAAQTYRTYRLCLWFHGRLDLASFVTTWMEPEAEEIIAATQAINMVDVSQYPQCAEMEQRYAPMHCIPQKLASEYACPLGLTLFNNHSHITLSPS